MSRYIEKKLQNEYLFERYNDKTHWIRPRLGQVPNTEMAKAHEVTLRFPDAIVIDDGVVKIIEFKMFPSPGVISQLELYAALFDKTLRFREYWPNPKKLVFVVPTLDRNLQQLCEEKGIEYDVYAPQWALNYIKKVKRVPI